MGWYVGWDDGNPHTDNWLFENSAVLHNVVFVEPSKAYSVFSEKAAKKYDGQLGVVLGGEWQLFMEGNGDIRYSFHVASVCFPFWNDFCGHGASDHYLLKSSPLYQDDKCRYINPEFLNKIPYASDELRAAYFRYLHGHNETVFMAAARHILLQGAGQLSYSSDAFVIP